MYKKIPAVNLFKIIFGHQKPGSVAGSGSGIRKNDADPEPSKKATSKYVQQVLLRSVE
jgi:hypothetical protein